MLIRFRLSNLTVLSGAKDNGKLQAMKNAVKSLDIQLISLNDVDGELPSINESGTTPLDNAEIKANNGKLQAMKNAVKSLDIQLISLNDVDGELPSINESGTTPLDNAEIKARAYYDVFHMFSLLA